jgi:hypothetical protein
MKKFVLLLILLYTYSEAQVDIRGSMGINFITTPSLRDYINQNSPRGEEIPGFNSAINFSAELNYYMNSAFAVGVEAAYLLNSFTFASDFSRSEFEYTFIMPSITAYYVIPGPGYNFKFGGGAGPRFISFSEKYTLSSTEYSSIGFGLLIKADGNTALGEKLFANIGTELRYDLNGSFTDKRRGEEISLDAFSFGIRLGLTYFIL